jgi:inosine triphosphate pyrophosphatase
MPSFYYTVAMQTIYFVTGNKGKLSEWQRLLPKNYQLESTDIDLPEIQSADSGEIVADKAKRAYEILGKPVVVEDVSAGLLRLGGLPGPFIKFFVEALGPDALYQLVREPNEKGVASCTIAYYDGENLITVKGEVEGTIVEPRGPNGFGFDKAFIPDGQTKTYGEMTVEEKDEVSHRSMAIKELIKALEA